MELSKLCELANETKKDETYENPRDKIGYHQDVGYEGYRNNLYGIDIEEEIRNSIKSKETSGEEPFLVFDLGCGSARLLRELSDRDWSEEIRFFGIDKSYCNTHIPDSNYLVGDVTDMKNLTSQGDYSIEDDTFDFLISRVCFEWIEDQISGIKESYRVLRSGGRGFLTCSISDRELKNLRAQGVSAEPLGYEEDFIDRGRGESKIGALKLEG